MSGEKIVDKMIPINMPQIDEKEVEAVTQVLKSGVLTTGLGDGPMVKQFEKDFADFVEAKNAVAVNSGTAALHLALLAADVGRGDEVIVPSFTFTATAETVVLVGAKPVFVDINPETYNINQEKIEDAVTEKAKAIMPVDLYGLPADMESVKKIAHEHGLTVIEDAAQAHGAVYKAYPPGHFADITCWSFYASKNMTTGEGGMLTTNNDDYVEKLRCMRSHGEKRKYMSTMIGHNFHMPEIAAAVGNVQLQKLPDFLEKRRRNACVLTEKLGGTAKLQLPNEPPERKHSWYLYTVRLKDADSVERDRIVQKLRKRSIGATVYYYCPIHLMPFYRQFGKYKLPKTEKAAQQVFSLPVHPGVSSEQANYISEAVLKLVS
ncbi:MAG: DegT/DnrJ/EryC1/StrS family aminotransferase [Thermoproteota archaeon]|nr:DegT/DnrJ/EryC1/StrS family aminotransferase [Thermoproteota archaeon]